MQKELIVCSVANRQREAIHYLGGASLLEEALDTILKQDKLVFEFGAEEGVELVQYKPSLSLPAYDTLCRLTEQLEDKFGIAAKYSKSVVIRQAIEFLIEQHNAKAFKRLPDSKDRGFTALFATGHPDEDLRNPIDNRRMDKRVRYEVRLSWWMIDLFDTYLKAAPEGQKLFSALIRDWICKKSARPDPSWLPELVLKNPPDPIVRAVYFDEVDFLKVKQQYKPAKLSMASFLRGIAIDVCSQVVLPADSSQPLRNEVMRTLDRSGVVGVAKYLRTSEAEAKWAIQEIKP